MDELKSLDLSSCGDVDIENLDTEQTKLKKVVGKNDLCTGLDTNNGPLVRGYLFSPRTT